MTGRGRVVRTWAGIAIIVVGFVAAVVLWMTGSSVRDERITSLAPAPPGCRTTLDFDQTGTYYLFVEVKGDVGHIPGQCDGVEGTFEVSGDPDPSLRMLDIEGNDVALDEVNGPAYNGAGGSGRAVQRFDIESAGQYTLEVDSPDSDFVVRVGHDPNAGIGNWRLSSIGAAMVAIGMGLVLIVLGRRVTAPPGPPAIAAAPAQWPVTHGPPVGPPTPSGPQPPYGSGWSGAPWASPQQPQHQPNGRPLPMPPPRGGDGGYVVPPSRGGDWDGDRGR